MSEVLVLDRSYRPHARWTWQDTMIKWAAGECPEFPDQPGIDILATYEDRIIHAGREIFMPCVVALRKTFKPDFKSIKFSRHNLYARDKGKCQYCGIRVRLHEFEYEHVVPKTQGGKTNWENIVVSCHACNQRKKGRTPEQAGMRLLHGSPRQ
ncbi:MAG: HNH endonuclease, partial [Anaerolineae bacterium]|nr:HNH endonuclease [Anaerolineae bacterium]